MDNLIEKPKCLNNLSFRKYLKVVAIEKLFDAVRLDIKGCLASAQMSADPIQYLKNKRAELNEKICQECQALGVLWKRITCNIDRIDEFYSLGDGLLRECVGHPILEQELEKESKLFMKYVTLIMSINEEIQMMEDQSHSKMSLGGGKYNEVQLNGIFWELKDNGYLTSTYGTVAFVNMGMNKDVVGGLQWIKTNDRNRFVSKSALLSLLIELGFEGRAAIKIAKDHFDIDLHRSTKPSKEHTTKIKEIILRATR